MRIQLLLLTLLAVPAAAQTPVPAAPAPAPAVPAPAAASTPRPPGLPAPRPYLLGVNDRIKVTVFEEPTLSNTYAVDSDGAFEYPYLGRIVARGKTTAQLQKELLDGLKNGWVNNPQVTVEMFQYRPRTIFVVGEVKAPGPQTVAGSTITLTEALAKAGWLSANAGTQAIITHTLPGEVLRPADTASADSNRQTRVNLLDLNAGKLEANIELDEGDTVMVQRAEKFYVAGQVKGAGSYTWEPGMTVRKALNLAGGISDKGSTRRMRIIRFDPKTNKEIRINNIEQTTLIQPEDTLEVLSRLL